VIAEACARGVGGWCSPHGPPHVSTQRSIPTRENVPVTPQKLAADPGRSVALLWGPQDKPARSGPTVRAVVAAGIAVADADGIEALSMRRTADRLWAATMSLYTHVPGKATLIELMIDAVRGQLYEDVTEPCLQPDGWRGAMRFVARRNWELYLAHPWLLPVMTRRPVLGRMSRPSTRRNCAR
jgi:hypothetical protein